MRARPTLAALVAAIREQLQLPSEAEVWRVISEGERLCLQGEPPIGTLMQRAMRLVETIGVDA